MDGDGGGQDSSGESPAVDKVAEEDVVHLHAVAGAAAVDEAAGVVGVRELVIGHRNVEKFAERLPALANAVLEELLLGYEFPQLGVIFAEDVFTILVKVAPEEVAPEFVEHWLVEAGAPIPLGDGTQLGVVGTPVDGLKSRAGEECQPSEPMLLVNN